MKTRCSNEDAHECYKCSCTTRPGWLLYTTTMDGDWVPVVFVCEPCEVITEALPKEGGEIPEGADPESYEPF